MTDEWMRRQFQRVMTERNVARAALELVLDVINNPDEHEHWCNYGRDEWDRCDCGLAPVVNALAPPSRPVSGPLAAERRDPFHGHHPEHPTPQEAAQ